MRITLYFTGKTKAEYLEEGIGKYLKRIGHYIPFTLEIIRDIKPGRQSAPDYVKSEEGKRIMQYIKPSDFVILLDERGKKYSSEGFAEKLNSLQGRISHLVFIVGGAWGFSDDLYRRANEKLSLSDMTFSHQMVRLIFIEQLYRALTILKGEPYHHF